jgi:hypothetical protein
MAEHTRVPHTYTYYLLPIPSRAHAQPRRRRRPRLEQTNPTPERGEGSVCLSGLSDLSRLELSQLGETHMALLGIGANQLVEPYQDWLVQTQYLPRNVVRSVQCV